MKHTKGDPKFIRSLNRRLVIDTLRRKGKMSRTDLGRRIGVEASTITSIVQDLMQEGLVKEVGMGTSTGGRRPILLNLNYNYGHTLGAKVEAERVLVGLISLDGRLEASSEAKYSRGSSPQKVFGALERAVVKLPQAARLLGVGVGISGFVHSYQNHLMYSPILGWKDEDLGTPLQEMFDCPISISNDVNALALGEKWHGVGRNFRHFICVTVGEGIGAGIYLEGHLYEGASGGAGELGHTCIQINGPQCRCGEYGCLEALASDDFLAREAQRYQLPLDPNKLVKAADNGDEKARDIFQQMGKHLGVGLKNLANLLNPEAIIIGGERLNALKWFQGAMEEELHRHSFSDEPNKIEIIAADLSEAGWLIGAGTLPLRARFLPSMPNNASMQVIG